MKTETPIAQHTPGPWTIEDTGDTMWIGQPRTYPGEKLFSIVAKCDGGNADGYVPNAHATKVANACLIAAAPELLEALDQLQSTPNDPRAHRKAFDAMRKARGRRA